MRVVVGYGRALRAPHLIPITRAHVDSCLYQGESSVEFAESLLRGGAKVVVPTTLNVGLVDLLHPSFNRGDPHRLQRGRELMRLYEAMGCIPTWTCAPYQLPGRPLFGEQVAWAESNAIVFLNSVIGARTDRYGDFLDICSGIVGRVPNHGLHRTENRRGRIVFDLSGLSERWFSNELLWPLLGFVVGSATGSRVPVIDGVRCAVSEDELKALGASAASSGSVALFHMVGVTPEAPDLQAALQGERPETTIPVTTAELRDAQKELTDDRPGALSAISIGTPHLSVAEFATLLELVEGQRRNPRVAFYVSTSRAVLQEVTRRGWAERLEQFGAEVVVDTCTYLTPVIRGHRGELVMTNSAKWAYYAPGNLGFRVVFASLGDCVRSAVSGRVVVDEPIPLQ